jgi:zinc/manganese transport system substrate-binding protein
MEPGTAEGHAGHSHGPDNPHVWLDPRLAIQQVATIREALVRLDPSCAEGYRTRAAAFSERLARLDSRLARALGPYRGRTLVTQHDVAPYLARRYGLHTVFLVPEPEVPASPADLRRVDAVVRAQPLGGVLVDPGEPAGALTALARDRGLTLITLDPLESASVAGPQAPEHFLAVMERNGEALLRALQQAGGGAAVSVK